MVLCIVSPLLRLLNLWEYLNFVKSVEMCTRGWLTLYWSASIWSVLDRVIHQGLNHHFLPRVLNPCMWSMLYIRLRDFQSLCNILCSRQDMLLVFLEESQSSANHVIMLSLKNEEKNVRPLPNLHLLAVLSIFH